MEHSFKEILIFLIICDKMKLSTRKCPGKFSENDGPVE